ncbi:hypothetical protein QBC43DRAFT_1047 [Cladorrhinum sp. PSN259]|nr:hypothetical protein QBC43DRAFT_1047 [Cladorrhinum sp. PSN259]
MAFISSKSYSEYTAGGSLSDVFCPTICGDVEYNRYSSHGELWRVSNGLHSTYLGWLNMDTKRRRTTSLIGGYRQESYASESELTQEDSELEKRNAFHYTIKRANGGRTNFITQKGYIRIGPKGMTSGDGVLVVSGSRVPFVLRPVYGSLTCRQMSVETLIREVDQ